MMMLIPEAWAGNPLMDEDRRAFYEYHAALMEPWDGPAAICFTDGRQIGATLDRNGLRPARYLVTDDGLVVLASEMGVLPIPEEQIVEKWRLQPGKMLLIDLEQGRIVSDDEIKSELADRASLPGVAEAHPDRAGGPAARSRRASRAPTCRCSIASRPSATRQEDLKLLMQPMAVTGQEAVGSMGTDTPISALSDKSKLLYTYFKQNFAQVTNPPIDPIREELVMSLVSFIGPRPNILDLEGTSRRKRLEVRQPILTNEDLEKIRSHRPFRGPRSTPRPSTSPIRPSRARPAWTARSTGCATAPKRRCTAATTSSSCRTARSGRTASPIPALLATRRRAQLPDPQGLAHLGRPRGRVRRAARGASLRVPRRLRRRGDQPVSRLRDADRACKDELPPEVDERRDRQPLHQVDRQGPAQGHVQDGHLDLSVLLRRADLRRGRAASPTSSTATSSAPRRRSKASAWPRSREETVRRHRDAFGDAPVYRHALDVGGEYAYRLRGEEPCLEPGHGRDAPARRAPQRAGPLPRVRAAGERAGEPPQDASAACSASRPPRRPAAPRFRWRRSSRRRRS